MFIYINIYILYRIYIYIYINIYIYILCIYLHNIVGEIKILVRANIHGVFGYSDSSNENYRVANITGKPEYYPLHLGREPITVGDFSKWYTCIFFFLF